MTWAASALFSARRRITTSRSRNRRAAQESTRKSIPRSLSGTSSRKPNLRVAGQQPRNRLAAFVVQICRSAVKCRGRPLWKRNPAPDSERRQILSLEDLPANKFSVHPDFYCGEARKLSSTSSLSPAYTAGIMRSAVTKSANRIGDVMLVVPHRLRHDEHQTQCDIVPAQLNPCHLRDSDP